LWLLLNADVGLEDKYKIVKQNECKNQAINVALKKFISLGKPNPKILYVPFSLSIFFYYAKMNMGLGVMLM